MATRAIAGGRAAHDLHRAPPLEPSRVLRRAVPGLIVALVALGVSAATQNGALLKTWDEPIQRAVEGARTPTMNAIMAAITQLGDKYAIAAVVMLLLPLVWRRCRALALVMIVSTLARPLLEFALKAAADRPRPDLERLLPGNGPSFPSGHVLAAVALWGLLPPVVALFTDRKRWWWISVATSALLVGAISASRIYLGVHWFSDVTGGLMVGALYLLAIERLLERQHARHGCAGRHVNEHEQDLRSHPSSS